MNIVKNKLRNRINVDTLNSILHVRFGLIKFNQTCCKYDIPKELLLKIGSKEKYKFILNKTARDEAQQPSTSSTQPINENLCDEFDEDSSDEDY